MNPIMSVKEARALLGGDAEAMTDEQVAKLVDDVDNLARLALRVAQDKLLEKKVKR